MGKGFKLNNREVEKCNMHIPLKIIKKGVITISLTEN